MVKVILRAEVNTDDQGSHTHCRLGTRNNMSVPEQSVTSADASCQWKLVHEMSMAQQNKTQYPLSMHGHVLAGGALYRAPRALMLTKHRHATRNPMQILISSI